MTGPAWDAAQVVFESRHLSGVPQDYQGIQTRIVADAGIRIGFPAEWLFSDLQLDLRIAEAQPPRPAEDVTVVAALRSGLTSRLDRPDLGPDAVARSPTESVSSMRVFSRSSSSWISQPAGR